MAQDDPAAAARVLARIHSAVERLAKHPGMGRAGRVPLTRELVISGTPFVAVYRVRADVEIIRVLHGAQSWPRD
jgi:toxin ParE1/3/4